MTELPMTSTIEDADLGWDDGWAAAFAPFAAGGRRPARVVAVHKETSIVRDGDGIDRSAGVSGRFRYEALATSDFPAVGDWVALEPTRSSSGPAAGLAAGPVAIGATDDGHTAEAAAADANGGAPGGATEQVVIAAVLPRRSAFRRSATDASRRSTGLLADEQVIAANIDVAFLVAGLDQDFNLRRMERYLAVAWSSGVTPVIVLNKADIASDVEGRRIAVEAIAPGVPIVVLSALTGDHVADLAPFLGRGTTAAVLGSSGVGKSTLVNTLLGESRQATAAVRAADSRGRHTTTHRELFSLPGGALLVDTPGIRSLEVAGADEGLDAAFDDIADLAATCRFSDCRHEGEPGCAIRAALDAGTLRPDRLASHQKLERELAHAERKVDPRARAEAARRWRQVQKRVERHMDQKYGRER